MLRFMASISPTLASLEPTRCKWIEDHIMSDEVCILVAYNGQNCDMKWLWKLTQASFSDGMSVKRHTKKRAKRDTIEAPRAQQDYSQFFNAVDRNDRDVRIIQ